MDGLARVIARAWSRKGAFLGLFLAAFLSTTALLGSLGLLPETPTADAGNPPAVAGPTEALSTVSSALPEEPVKIEIPKIGLSATIADPDTTDVEALDRLLLKGAVRYPTSARLGEDGNLVLFGHSSYLPIVKNQAYKTFDGIQKLSAGDLVTVYSSDTAYTYRVRSMTKEKAAEGAIPLSVSGRVLTLSTCNSFATKDDRFVVTADLIGSHPLGA